MPTVLWKRAPHILLTRFPQIFIAIATAALILASIAASGELFLASSEKASVEREIDGTTPIQAGFRVSAVPYQTEGDRPTLDALLGPIADRLDDDVAPIEHVGSSVSTIMGRDVEATVASGRRTTLRLINRSGAFDNVELLDGGSGEGAWIADTSARQLNIGVGDAITVSITSVVEGRRSVLRESTVEVAGVYRFLPDDRPRDFWRSLDTYVYKTPFGEFPSALVLLDRRTMLDLFDDGFDYEFVRWEYPVTTSDLSLPEATTIATRFDDLAQDLFSVDVAANLDADSGMRGIVSVAENRLESVTPVVALLSLAAGGVALSLMAAAGFFLVKRRRIEVAGLAARGVGPIAQGVRYAVEAVPPLLMGGVVGPLLAYLVVLWLGPAGPLPKSAIGPAVGPVSLAMAAGWVLFASAAAFSVAREERALSSPPHDVAGVRWLLLLGAAVGVATALVYRWIQGQTYVAVDDPAATTFPLLAAALAGILAAALLKLVLAWIAPQLRTRFAPGYLAARRLSGASTLTHVLVIAGVSALGMMLYGVTMSASVEESVTSKAAVFVGSDLSTLVSHDFSGDLPYEHTIVRVLPRVALEPGTQQARMMGVDTEKFADVALWKDDFASRPLEALMDDLEGGSTERPNVIVAGTTLPEGTVISVSGDDIPIEVVGTATSFPGMANEGATLILNDAAYAQTLTRMSIYSQPNLWVKGDAEEIAATLAAIGANTAPPRTVEQVIQDPAIQSALGILGVLSALGAAAGIIVVIGLLLYLQARHRSTVVSSALTRRMGLTRRQEYRAWFFEIAGALVLSFVAAAIIVFPVASVMNPRLDPRPDLAPVPDLVIPKVLVLVLAMVVVLIAIVSAWRIQRGIDKTDIAQEMRT
jgi:putative ABC transport system permease protein